MTHGPRFPQVVKSHHDEALLANRLKEIRLELTRLEASNVYHHSLAPGGLINLDEKLAALAGDAPIRAHVHRQACMFRFRAPPLETV